MKNREKSRIWDLIDYLISELRLTVSFKYDEITVYHPAPDGEHWHIRFNNENIIEQLITITKTVEDYLKVYDKYIKSIY